MTVRESVRDAVSHIVSELFSSDLGLPEYAHQNPLGIQNQYFKDSLTSLIFSDPGKYPNLHAPIVEIGTLGITYDALKNADKLLSEDERNAMCSPAQVEAMFRKKNVQEVFDAGEIKDILNAVAHGELTTFDALGKIIQKQLVTRCWLPDENYFASALDRDPQTQKVRVVDGIGSNPASLLKTQIFDDLPEADQAQFVSGIVHMITGPEFLTEAGHRGRALRHKESLRNPATGDVFDDYHGVTVVWAQEVSETIEGLLKWKQYDVAEQFMNRHTNAINITGAHEEFHYVDEQGRLGVVRLVDWPQEPAYDGEVVIFNNTNHNEKPQAWTVSSNYRVKRLRTDFALNSVEQEYDADWQRALNSEVMQSIRARGLEQSVYKTRAEIDIARERPYRYFVDFLTGREADDKIRGQWGCSRWFEA